MNKNEKILKDVNELKILELVTYIDIFNLALNSHIVDPNFILEWRPVEPKIAQQLGQLGAIIFFMMDGSKLIYYPSFDDIISTARKVSLKRNPWPSINDIKESTKIPPKNKEEEMARIYLKIKRVNTFMKDTNEHTLEVVYDNDLVSYYSENVYEAIIKHALKELEYNKNCCYEEYKGHKIYKSLDGNSYYVCDPGAFAVTFKTLEMAKRAIDRWEDSQKIIYEPIKFEKPKDSQIPIPKIPQPIKNPMTVTIGSENIEISTQIKKKRGRPKKVTEHDDKVDAISMMDVGKFDGKPTPLLEKVEVQLPAGSYPFESMTDLEVLKNNFRLVLSEKELRACIKNNYDSSIAMINVTGTSSIDTLGNLVERFIKDVSIKVGFECNIKANEEINEYGCKVIVYEIGKKEE